MNHLLQLIEVYWSLIVITYFMVNLFYAGYNLGANESEVDWRDWGDIAAIMLIIIFSMAFGVLYLFVSYIVEYSVKLWNYFNNIFQLSFWFCWFFTKKFYNMDKDELYNINRKTAILEKINNNLQSRIFRKCTDLVNKRNNYTYKPIE